VTLENPIEFLHRDVNCSMTQREVGVDTESFAIGLQAALRQDPDVVVIGEMRDSETLDTAIKASEMGHLVISAMPTPDVMSTIHRLLSMFPHDERDIGRLRLSEALRAILAQRLLPRRDDQGRVAAVEVMIGIPQIRACIQDPEKLDDLKDKIAKGREAHGMQTFDQHLVDLVEEGEISVETARAAMGESDSPRKRRSGS
jgi:twitching motility protein PilT